MFPRLKERQHTEAGVLSGGEQQMLTLCRTLMGDPDLIMIDEPTEGLAPKIVELVAEYLRELKRRGISVLLVEQKLTIALEVADRCLVMGHGRSSSRARRPSCAPTPISARSGWRSTPCAQLKDWNTSGMSLLARAPPKMKALMGTPSGFSQSASMEGHWLAGRREARVGVRRRRPHPASSPCPASRSGAPAARHPCPPTRRRRHR
jgi:energy-coupling factor transporter ATP-binding protein EcfA2